MKIVVLGGGISTERSVSLVTATSVCRALRDAGHKAIFVDMFLGLENYTGRLEDAFDAPDGFCGSVSISETAPDLEAVKASRRLKSPSHLGVGVLDICALADCVFLGLHGIDGEDGKIQAALELLGVPYTGSGPLGSAMAMDKAVAKRIMESAGILTPKWREITYTAADVPALVQELPVPCVALCPAGVDVPGYMALVGEGRCADAVRLIRKDNPFPTACAYICEHPCEARCRRNMIDDAINIRGLKRYAVDHAGDVPQPACAPPTGKKVAIIGGGPSGLSCAYYLALMGHKVTVFEEREKLGGMLRYGIPSYRFPRQLLDAEIESILSLGIEAHTGTTVGVDVWVEELQKEYDCLYIAIGAHQDKKVGIPGEDSKNVMSAVEMLRAIGDDVMPDFSGKQVVVIGGGNVAMDVTRSSIRLGADKVTCVYRRRIEDMTALPDEVTGAMAEGAEIQTLMAPVRIEADEDGCATALWVQPQIIGEADKSGRPRPNKADLPEVRIPADIIVVAIGQGIEIQGFEQAGVPIKRGRHGDPRHRRR